MKKRLFILLAIVATLMCLFAISASAVAVDGIEYTLNDSAKTATVGNNQSSTVEAVVIPETITVGENTYNVVSISSNAFNGNATIKSFVATSIETIGSSVFSNSSVTSINISSPLKSISHQTFRYCASLTELTIINTDTSADATATTFDYYMCAENTALLSVTLGGKIAFNSNNAFSSCTALTTVKLLDGVQAIGTSAFAGCTALTSLYLADSITTIQDNALMTQGSALTFVDENGNPDNFLPTSLTTINGHFLKQTTITNTALIFPESYTDNYSTSGYDFESMGTPDGFKMIFLGKMTRLNLSQIPSKNMVIYLTKNSASDITNLFAKTYVNGASVSDNGGEYSHTNANGTLTLTLSNNISNGINKSALKIYFCGSDELCMFTRRNNLVDNNGWANYVTTPITYEQATTIGLSFDKHPIIDNGAYYEPTCEATGGTKYLCVGCKNASKVENEIPALGHSFTILTDIVYARFDADGYKVLGCDRDGCDASDNSTVAPVIFTHKGYSYKENSSKGGIYSEFSINTSALQEYEEFYTTTVSFGIAIFNPAYLTSGTTAFFNGEKINAETGIVQVELNENSRKYSRLNCLINGFDKTNASHTALELVIAGFAIEDGKVQIMQKQYEVNAENPVNAPYLSKVTRDDAVLYTVSIGTVEENVAFTSTIKEYTAPTVTQ